VVGLGGALRSIWPSFNYLGTICNLIDGVGRAGFR
jgi:hypothetical protein